MTAGSHMCWASRHLASDQEGLVGQQMARMSGMQEVSGLDAAHKDDQTYGEENPVQDLKTSIFSAQFRLRSPENAGLGQLTGTKSGGVLWRLGNNSAVQHRKIKMSSMKRFSFSSHSLFQPRPPLWKTAACQGGKTSAKPDLFGRLQEVKSGTLAQTSHTLARRCCVQRLCTITSLSCVSISV